jgi:capsular polysaccharide biosynthesis protein
MPDLLSIISQWKKQIIILTVLSALVAGITVYFKKDKYLSVATALPASLVNYDKSRLFSDNIEQLYSATGIPEDLDNILGTAKLDTVYLAVADSFNLVERYQYTGENIRLKAAWTVKENTRVTKSDYGELKVKVWDTDKQLAPKLANAILYYLQQFHENIQNSNNIVMLNGLEREIATLQKKADSLSAGNKYLMEPLQSVLAEIQQYRKLAGEYRVAVNNKAKVLLVSEWARPAIKPDKPQRVQIILLAAVLSFFFSLLLALVFAKKK